MDTLEKQIRRERITKLFFKALAIENPTQDQLQFCNGMDEGDMNKPIIINLKSQGFSFGEISKKIGINNTNVKKLYYGANRKRLLKVTTNTENSRI